MAEKTDVKEIEADLKRMLNMAPVSAEKSKQTTDDKEIEANLKKILLNKSSGNETSNKGDRLHSAPDKSAVTITKEDLATLAKSTGSGSHGQTGKKKAKAKGNKKKTVSEDATAGTPHVGSPRGSHPMDHPHHQTDPQLAPGATVPGNSGPTQKKKKKKKRRKKRSGEGLQEGNSDTDDSDDEEPAEPARHQAPAVTMLTTKYLDETLTLAVLNELEKERIFPLKKKSMKFAHAKYFCRLCDYHCDNVPVCRQHASDARHRRRKEIMIQDKKLQTLPEPSPDHVAALDALIGSICGELGLSRAEMAHREGIVRQLQEHLTETIPDIQLRMYGSSLTGFGLKTSDVNIDLVVEKKSQAAHQLAHVYKVLKSLDVYKDVKSNFMAKVPAVVFKSPCGSVECQITVGTDTAYYTSRYLRIYADMDPRVTQLAITFRHWAKICQVDVQENGSLPAYSYGLMAVYYLQQCRPPVLPVIWKNLSEEALRRPKTPKDILDTLDTLEKEKWTSENELTVGQLWRDMLLFYGIKFDLKECIICIRALKPLLRAEKKWKSKRVAIEDPFSSKRNVARSLLNTTVFDYFFNCLRKACVYFSLPTSRKDISNYMQVGNETKAKRKGPGRTIRNDSKVKREDNDKKSADGKAEVESEATTEDKSVIAATKAEDTVHSENVEKQSEESDVTQEHHTGTDRSSEGGILDNSFFENSKAGVSDSNKSSIEVGAEMSVREEEDKDSEEKLNEDILIDKKDGKTRNSVLSSNDSQEQTDEKSTEVVQNEELVEPEKMLKELDIGKETIDANTDEMEVQEQEVNKAISSKDESDISKEDSKEKDDILGATATGEASESMNETCDKTELEKPDGAANKSCDSDDDFIASDAESGSGLNSTRESETSDSSPIRRKRSNKTSDDGEFNFKFTLETLTDGKGPSIFCQICEKEGHLKGNCPEDVLPDIIELPPVTPQHIKFLNSAIQQVPKDFRMTQREMEDREAIVYNLESHVQEVFPEAEMCLFGSSRNGYGFHQSDLDICVTFHGKRPEDLDFVGYIEAICKRLKTHRGLYNVFPITTAKVPIVKFKHRGSQLEGDISLYNILAQQNTNMLYTYSQVDRRVITMVFAIKVFVKVCDIGDASRGSLSSYAYTLLMLHYLQHTKPPVLPVLQELRTEDDPEPEHLIEGWNAWFYDDLDNLPTVWPGYGKNKQTVGELWLGFFRYYMEEFSFMERVVTIRQFEPLTKFEKLWNGRCIAIEDPFDLNHNLGGALSRKMNQFILRTFVHARELYGTPIAEIPQGFNSVLDYFFDQEHLTEGEPPSDRLCRVCSKIGHIAKDCPRLQARKEREANERKRKEEMRRANDEKDAGSPGRPSTARSLSDPSERDSPVRGRGQQYHRQHSYTKDSSPGKIPPLMNMNVPNQDKYSRNAYHQPSSPQQSQSPNYPRQSNPGSQMGYRQPSQGYYNTNQNYRGSPADSPGGWRQIQAQNTTGSPNYYPRSGHGGHQKMGHGQRPHSGGNREYSSPSNQYQPYTRHQHPEGQVLINMSPPGSTYLPSTGYMFTNPYNQYARPCRPQAATVVPCMATSTAGQQHVASSESCPSGENEDGRNRAPVYVQNWFPAGAGVPLYVNAAPLSEAGAQTGISAQSGSAGQSRVVNVHKSQKPLPDVGITVKNEYYRGRDDK